MIILPRALLVLLLTGTVACGGDEQAPSDPGGGSAPQARDCGSVQVPGHEAVSIEAIGPSCAQAVRVAAAAQGRGRQPYEAAGFACTPSEAGGGDTDYACEGAGGRIAFRYGAA